MPLAVVVMLLLFTAAQLPAAEPALVIDDFEQGLARGWEVKAFEGQTEYTVVPEAGGGHVLRAEAVASASGLVFKKAYDLRDYPILAWRWKIEQTLEGGDARRKSGDGARAAMIIPPGSMWFFPTGFPRKAAASTISGPIECPERAGCPTAISPMRL